MHLIGRGGTIPTEGGSAQSFQGASDLQAIASCNPFAQRAMKILRFFVRHWNVTVSLGSDMGRMDDSNELCQPSFGSMNFFCLNIGALLSTTIQSYTETPIFTPFPMQGSPLLCANGDGLKYSGFLFAGKCEGMIW
jgi:hypothetical protein